MFKKILVPLDGSPLSEAALSSAMEIASKFSSEITLLRVLTSTMLYESVNEVTNIELLIAQRNEAHEKVYQYLKGLKGSLRQQGYKVHTQMVVNQNPPDAILDVAEAQEMDMIIMSTHGRGGFSRWVYGSVADKVLRKCHVPILLVKPEEQQLAAFESAERKSEMPLM